MEHVKLTTIYKYIERLKPRRIALVTQRLREEIKREHGFEVVNRFLREREEIFKSKLLEMSIRHIPFSEPELVGRSKEFHENPKFDMCVISGEPLYQLFAIAASVRRARYEGPIFLEITEDDAINASRLQTAQTNAKRYGVDDLLRNLVYLKKTMPQGTPREIEFDISGPPPNLPQIEKPKRAPRKTLATASERRATTYKSVSRPAADIDEPPKRFDSRISRIIRDTATARELKARYEFRCQVCNERIEVSRDTFYAEVHHVRPLGGGHNGLDTERNMLVLCPNHHAMFDFGIPRFLAPDRIEIERVSILLNMRHELATDVINYHNANLWKSEGRS